MNFIEFINDFVKNNIIICVMYMIIIIYSIFCYSLGYGKCFVYLFNFFSYNIILIEKSIYM